MDKLNLPDLTSESKEFKRQYLNILNNQKYFAQVQDSVQQERLRDMEGRLERMTQQVEISQNAIAELQKDPTYEARQKRKAEEEKLAEWEGKVKWQREEIIKLQELIEKVQENSIDLEIYIKKAGEIKN